MIPLTQTKVHQVAPDGKVLVRGNCYAACWASILEIPIEEVPQFEELPNDGSWLRKTWEWLNSRGLQMGYSKMEDVPDGIYTLTTGPSPRGPWGHCVVYHNHQLVHDPHPSRDGLTKVDYHLWAISTKV